MNWGKLFEVGLKVVVAVGAGLAVFMGVEGAMKKQDVDVANRGVGRLHKPQDHMLWNLDFLADEEKTNPDYKQLIDNLRTYGLMPYYISKEYRNVARKELAKVDWQKQPEKNKKLYKKPIFMLKCRDMFLKYGSLIKRKIVK